MATLLAHISVVPGKEASFERIAAELYRHTHADEAAVRRYEYWRGAEPGTYYCLESFPDLLGFIAHQSSDHHEAAGTQFAGMFASLRLEWVDPLAQASPLAATNPAELPADASELARRYHAQYGSVLAEWWLALRAVSDPPEESH